MTDRQEMTLVRLKKKVTDAKPFPFSHDSVADGQPMIVVSATQHEMPMKVPPGELIVQKCTARKTSQVLNRHPQPFTATARQHPALPVQMVS